jgi:hypothetical protein
LKVVVRLLAQDVSRWCIVIIVIAILLLLIVATNNDRGSLYNPVASGPDTSCMFNSLEKYARASCHSIPQRPHCFSHTTLEASKWSSVVSANTFKPPLGMDTMAKTTL